MAHGRRARRIREQEQADERQFAYLLELCRDWRRSGHHRRAPYCRKRERDGVPLHLVPRRISMARLVEAAERQTMKLKDHPNDKEDRLRLERRRRPQAKRSR